MKIFFTALQHLMTVAIIALCCFSCAATAFAEAKALEFSDLFSQCYVHTMNNEFANREAYFYNDADNPENSWGEIRITYISGENGSSTEYMYLGDFRQGDGINGLFQVKRIVIVRKNALQQKTMHKIDDVDFTLLLLPQDDGSFRLSKTVGAEYFREDAVGEYRSSAGYQVMSGETAEYVLERCLMKIPEYAAMLEGAGIMYLGQPTGGSHGFKIVEQHPDHVVTRGAFQVTNTGLVIMWDVETDSWKWLTE